MWILIILNSSRVRPFSLSSKGTTSTSSGSRSCLLHLQKKKKSPKQGRRSSTTTTTAEQQSNLYLYLERDRWNYQWDDIQKLAAMPQLKRGFCENVRFMRCGTFCFFPSEEQYGNTTDRIRILPYGVIINQYTFIFIFPY